MLNTRMRVKWIARRYSPWTRVLLVLWLALVAVGLPAASVQAANAASAVGDQVSLRTTTRPVLAGVPDGLAWLVNRQRQDGSWADSAATTAPDTFQALTTVQALNGNASAIQAAANWAASARPENAQDLAYQILILKATGRIGDKTTTDLDEKLIAMRSPLAGLCFDANCTNWVRFAWGYAPGHDGDVVSTVLVLRALTALGYQVNELVGTRYIINDTLNELYRWRKTTNGWGFSSQDSTNVLATAAVVEALYPYRGWNFGSAGTIQSWINGGVTWLRGQQQASGGWGYVNDSGAVVVTPAHSGVATWALYQVASAPANTTTAKSYLLGAQQADGSWGGSAYTTALATRALSRLP